MLNHSLFRRRLRTFTALICVLLVVGCGGGVSADVVVVASPPSIAPLAIALTRVGPEAIQVDWSDDPYVASFIVSRDGYTLANVTSHTLIDASVIVDGNYCYHVSGYDPGGILVAASDTACVTIFP